MSLNCLPTNELEEFAAGKIESERFDLIATHIDSCNRCQETVIAMIDPSDTIVAKLRGAGSPAELKEDSILESGLNKIIQDVQAPQDSHAGRAHPTHVDVIESVGPYRIEDCLGVGGMGTVYKATHTKLKRTVAIKILPSGRWANAAAVTRFHREMEAIGKLDHPNIVRATDAGEHDGMHYLAMDFVDGLNLSQISKRVGILPVADACRLIQQAAIGLHYAHANGLIHRDIKPSNIMLSRAVASDSSATLDPSVKVLDLGLALLGTENLQHDHEFTTVGQLMGTLDYMSPEQGLDSHEIDTRADVYSLGATLFRLLTGRSPLDDEKYNTLMKKMTALATVPVPSIATMRDDLPAELIGIVDRMLARDPEDRFASSRDVADALDPFVSGSDLSGLMKRALDVPAVEDENAAKFFPYLRTTATSRKDPQPELAIHSESGKDGFLKRLGLAFSGFAIFAASIAIYLVTDKGELVIRSDEPVQLEIKKGERVIEPRLVVDTKEKKIELRSGEYTIKLIDAPAGLTISKNEVSLRRNKDDVVTVQPKNSSSGVESPQIENVEKISTLTYGGRTLAEWRSVLDNDLKVELLSEALVALKPSPTLRHPYEATLDDVFRIARIYGRADIHDNLQIQCKYVVESHDPAQAASRIRREITDGNKRSRQFLNYLLYHQSTTEPTESYLSRGLKAQIKAQLPRYCDAIAVAFQKGDSETRRWTLTFIPPLLTAVPASETQFDKLTRLYVNALESNDADAINASLSFVGWHRESFIPIMKALFQLVAENRLDDEQAKRVIAWSASYLDVDEATYAKSLIKLYQATNNDTVKKLTLSYVSKLKSSSQITLPFLKELLKKEKGANLDAATAALATVDLDASAKAASSTIAQKVQSNQPRYNGQTFDEWYARIQNERTPTKYISVMPALSKLAKPGKQTEKAIDLGFYILREIVDVMEQNSSYHLQLSDETIRGLMRLPADLVVERLMIELEDEPTASSRKYVGELISGQQIVSNPLYQDFNAEIKSHREEIAILLLQLSEYDSATTQKWALNRLGEFCRQRRIDPNSLEEVVERFQQELEAEDVSRVAEAAVFLQGVALKNDGLAEPLTKIISSPFSEYDVAHRVSMQLLANLNDHSETVIESVLDLVERAIYQAPENQHVQNVIWAAIQLLQKTNKANQQKALNRIKQLDHVALRQTPFGPQIVDLLNSITPSVKSVEKNDKDSHQHATTKEAEECSVCRIAMDSIKNAEAIVENARVQFETGTADGSDYNSAMVHLLNMKLKYARIQNDDGKALTLLRSIIDTNKDRVQMLEVRYRAGELQLETLLKARQDLNEANLEYEREKQKKGLSEQKNLRQSPDGE